MGSAHTLGGHKIALAFSPTVALWTAAAVSAAPSRRRPPWVRRRPERHRILPAVLPAELGVYSGQERFWLEFCSWSMNVI